MEELIANFADEKDPLRAEQVPTTPAGWTVAQLANPAFAHVMDHLNGTNCVNLHPHGKKDAEHFDYLFRERDEASQELGPLTRVSAVNRTISNGTIVTTTLQRLTQIVVPPLQVPSVLHRHHRDMGHPGGGRMYRTVRQLYWWPQLVADCKGHATQCRYCELRKVNNFQPKIPVQEYPVPLAPHHTVAVDLTGPFPPSHGFVYILVYKCALTKWVEVVPLPNKTAVTVAAALTDIFNRHGAPSRMLSDRGKEFKNSTLKAVCDLLGTQHISITPVNPRANGLAENMMLTLKNMLSAYVTNTKTQDNWSEHISAVAHIYNTTVNDSTNYTPFFLNYGRQCATPDTEYLLKPTKGKDLDSHANGLSHALQCAWESLGGSSWRTKTTKYNARPSKPLDFIAYKPNQLVYLKRIPRRFYKDLDDEKMFTLSSKLQARYAGPYRILEKKSDVLYTAQVHGKVRFIHAVNMKPAHTALHIAPPIVDQDQVEVELEHELLNENTNQPDIDQAFSYASTENLKATQRDQRDEEAANQLMILRDIQDVFK